ARLDRRAADLGVDRRLPAEVHDGRDVAQQLLDRRRQQRQVAAQLGHLLGVLEQRERARGDEVARRLRAGVLQQQEERRDLELREALSIDLGLRQQREQVVARRLLALAAQRV